MTKHLYMILFPNTALVASHLEPEAFARHFISGSTKYYAGKLIFSEIDINFRHPYFRLDEALNDLVPHEDGRPKSTKYVSNYRVLEHVSFDAIQSLWISTPEGHSLELKAAPYDGVHQQEGSVRVYGEISPISMMVLSDFNFLEFASHITDPNNLVGAPVMFYTQLELDSDDFIKSFDANPLMQSPIPDIHPGVLKKSILEVRQFLNKHTKGLSLSNPLGKVAFKNLRHGFMFASQAGTKYFPMPDAATIEKTNYKFWKFM